MRDRMVWQVVGIGLAAIAGVATLSLTLGQTPPVTAPTGPTVPPVAPAPLFPAVAIPPAGPAAPDGHASVDVGRMPPLTRQMFLSAQRGTEWLYRMNQVNGRFRPGWSPALGRPLEGDHFLRQAAATVALARAARFSAEERHAARAAQAILTLLAETQPDPADATCRYTMHPPQVVDRLESAGLLVLAIHELPAADDKLLDPAEQLCRYISKRQRADGSLAALDPPSDAAPAVAPEAPVGPAGAAMHGLMVSQRLRPAPWKDDVLRKALPYYRARWKARPSPEFAPGVGVAFSLAYLHTKEPACAEFAVAVNDWICGLQYAQADARHPLWWGGFRRAEPSGPAAEDPDVTASASFAESLAEACQVAARLPDQARPERYRAALVRALQFLTTLQYTEDNATYFAPAYRREYVVGGFHASPRDGDLRVEDTARAVAALVQYLRPAADRP